MSRENRLREVIEKGNKFQEIIENEVFRETIKLTEQRICKEWQEAQTTQERESKWYLLQALKTLLMELRIPVAEKHLALQEMSQLDQEWE
ncbi:hypothetical protein [Methylobacter sp.]|uniref:hypothetical protein n=1 Tax=Methylobacter sp. TaxID=2051955 RepID=UPI003DA43EC9